MVFVALPALQKSQRDKQRQNDVSEIIAAMENYRSKNGGRLPGTIVGGSNNGRACFMSSGANCGTLDDLEDFMNRYVPDDIDDPVSGRRNRFVAAGISGASCKEQVNKMDVGGNLYNFYGNSGLVICYETKCDGSYTASKQRNSATIYYHQEFGGMVCKEF